MRYVSIWYFANSYVIYVYSLSRNHWCQPDTDREYQLKWTRACHCIGWLSDVAAISYFQLFFSFAVIILTINSLLYCQTVCGASNYRWSWAITSGVPALLVMVLLSCALCNGAIKYHVKRWCQLLRWCTSQFAILLIPYVIIICSRYGSGISI